MILRPLGPLPAAGAGFSPAWSVVERLQRQSCDGCWMITQPSHAALAGEFAEKLADARVPPLGPAMVRAIALHDAGWGVPDAQAIMQSRSVSQESPKSFVECGVNEFLFAWEKSIDVAASTSAAGGYVVSRHFHRLAEQRVHGEDHAPDEAKLARFIENETRRQGQLAARQEHSPAELELLTDVLQFCDLLSLYVCSGARENAEFPEYFGVKRRLTMEGESYKLDPAAFAGGVEFQVAALRHPAKAGASASRSQWSSNSIGFPVMVLQRAFIGASRCRTLRCRAALTAFALVHQRTAR